MPHRPAADMTPRTVAGWDSERNPSVEAAQFIRERMAQARGQLTAALDTLSRAGTESDRATVKLRRYTTEKALHREHPDQQTPGAAPRN